MIIHKQRYLVAWVDGKYDTREVLLHWQRAELVRRRGDVSGRVFLKLSANQRGLKWRESVGPAEIRRAASGQ